MTVDLRELASSVLEGHRVSSTLDVRAGACHVRVRTNSEALRNKLADYFRIWVVTEGEPDVVVTALETDAPELTVPFVDWERDAGKVGRKDAYADISGGRAVRKVRTGMQYLIGGDQKLVFGPSLRNYNQVVNFVVAQVINWLMHGGDVLCHAAGVTRGASGLAIAGISGAGKSTLALRLVTKGVAFTSNDRLLIGRNGAAHRMNGVPKQPRINPGTALSIPELDGIVPPERAAVLRGLSQSELWNLEEKHDADVARLFGDDRFQLAAPLTAFLVLRWKHDDPAPVRFTRVDLAERRDVLAAIMKPPGPFYQPKSGTLEGVYRDDEERYLAALDGLPVYEATGHVDFEAAVEFCLRDLLEERERSG